MCQRGQTHLYHIGQAASRVLRAGDSFSSPRKSARIGIAGYLDRQSIGFVLHDRPREGRRPEGRGRDPAAPVPRASSHPAPPGKLGSFCAFVPHGWQRQGLWPWRWSSLPVGGKLGSFCAFAPSSHAPGASTHPAQPEIGFVSLRLIECSIHHNSLPTKHLPLLPRCRNWVCFAQLTGRPEGREGNPGSQAESRPAGIGFVSHDPALR